MQRKLLILLNILIIESNVLDVNIVKLLLARGFSATNVSNLSILEGKRDHLYNTFEAKVVLASG
jgi:hypothetical protein